MPTRSGHRRVLVAAVVITLAAPASANLQSATPAAAASLTTAWHGGAFSENVGGVVSRSDVVLGQPNTANSQSLPLGNGSLGVCGVGGERIHRAAQSQRHDAVPPVPRQCRSRACRR